DRLGLFIAAEHILAVEIRSDGPCGQGRACAGDGGSDSTGQASRDQAAETLAPTTAAEMVRDRLHAAMIPFDLRRVILSGGRVAGQSQGAIGSAGAAPPGLPRQQAVDQRSLDHLVASERADQAAKQITSPEAGR